ncbi:MAG: DinB family protein [Candidatus Thorarchaeota archaeon]
MKESTIDMLRMAESNLLYSFKDIQPEEVHKRINPEFNSISWMLGHCFAHFHMILCSTSQGENLLNEDVIHYYRYGTTKREIDEVGSLITFEELVDTYLEISKSGYSYLEQLNANDFRQVIFPDYEETLVTNIQRMSLHYLGHVEQIVLIRKSLGNPGASFVGGAHPERRKKMLDEWISWWKTSKKSFNV